MKFKNWLNNDEFMEMSNIHDMPTDNVHFEKSKIWDQTDYLYAQQKCRQNLYYKNITDEKEYQKELENCIQKYKNEFETNQSFISKFQHQESNFEVHLDRWTIDYAGHEIPGSFEISFKIVNPTGGRQYQATNQFGTEATAIYTKVLLAIKKLFETQEVNALRFEAAEPKMALIYKKFYDRFLKNEFIRISPNEIARKSYIDNINKTLSQHRQAQIRRDIENTEKESDYEIELAKKIKIETLKAKRLNATMSNKLLKMNDGASIFISEIFFSKEYNKIMAQGVSDENGRGSHFIRTSIENITDKPADLEAGQRLLKAAFYQGDIFVNSKNREAIEELKKQYKVDDEI